MAGETAQQFSVCIASIEKQSPVPCTHVRRLRTASNSSSTGIQCLQSYWARPVFTDKHTENKSSRKIIFIRWNGRVLYRNQIEKTNKSKKINAFYSIWTRSSMEWSSPWSGSKSWSPHNDAMYHSADFASLRGWLQTLGFHLKHQRAVVPIILALRNPNQSEGRRLPGSHWPLL